MDTDDLVKYALQIFEAAPGLLAAGIDITELMGKGKEVLSSGRNPTDQEWDDLNALISGRRGRLHAPDA